MTVEIYVEPWVSGKRVAAYFGPVEARDFVKGDDEDEWADAQEAMLESLCAKAEALGANAVLGVTIELDPFREQSGIAGLSLWALGTAALLEPLF